MAARPDRDYEASDISRFLCQQIDPLARMLLPRGRKVGNEWAVGSVYGEEGTSLKIVLDGPKKGMWQDFSEAGGKGDKGKDPIDLLKEVRGLTTAEAIEQARTFLGLDTSGPKPEAPQQTDRAEYKRQQAEKARRLWQDCQKAQGTLVETYLKARGITDGAGNAFPPPPTIRFHPRLKHWLPPKEKGGKPNCDHAGPAMIAALIQPDRTITAVQQTWLRGDGSWKADVDPDKKTKGDCRGGAVRLSKPAKVLWVAEGIETGLSILADDPSRMVWVTLGTSNLKNLEVPEPSVERVIFCCDGDPESKSAAVKTAKRLRESNFACERAFAPDGYDFNDVIMGRAKAQR